MSESTFISNGASTVANREHTTGSGAQSRHGLRLAELTWEEATDAIQHLSVAVLPIGGGTKEHGPHLPCGTDQLVIEELADRVVQAAPVLLLPTLAYAYYPAFIEWPGSVSISASSFTGFVGDIVRSLYRHGIKRFLILDGGVSTHFPLRILANDLHNELGIEMAVTSIRGLGKEVEDQLSEQEGGGHADEMETSRMLAVRPDLVYMDKAVREVKDERPGIRGQDWTLKVAVAGRMTTRTGVNGDPTLATREKGEQLLSAMTRDILAFLESFAG